MKVKDVMTGDVITVGPHASIHRAAQLMVEHGVSGLPVVADDGTLVGIITEGDLIVRQKPRPRLSWWQHFFSDPERLAREYRRAAGITVGEVMTRPVISIPPEASLGEAAALLEAHRIRRLPVVVGGELVGIVSRGDLIKALASAPPPEGGAVTDAELAREMRRRVSVEPWSSALYVLVEARAGVITLWGMVENAAERSGLETMARAIPGCRDVDSHLMLRADAFSRYGAA